jgi:hypothetical protein
MSSRRGVVVDVFFLRVVNPRDGFDGFNDSLPVAQQQRIVVSLRQSSGQTRQEMG